VFVARAFPIVEQRIELRPVEAFGPEPLRQVIGFKRDQAAVVAGGGDLRGESSVMATTESKMGFPDGPLSFLRCGRSLSQL
jgi:hypothetical protein